MRAWSLVRMMNDSFSEPVVVSRRGGATRGGASLTEIGERVLSLYREMEAASLRVCVPARRRLNRYLRL
jgi:molybdate transport system regulatory protein